MSSTENITQKSSPFGSVFGRKKRVNGTKSADDIKGAAAALSINNGQAVANGFIDAEDIDALKESSIVNGQPPQGQTRIVDSTRHPVVSPSNSTFIDKVRYQRSSRSKNLRDAEEIRLSSSAPPTKSRTLPTRTKVDNRKRSQLAEQKKAFSADAVFMHTDPAYLMEALETLGDVPPVVARSIPKHAVVDTSDFAQRSLRNCLFDASVYENMLCDSLKVCDMLQSHLNECIVTIRARSPEGRHYGRLNEESDSEVTYENSSSQQTVVESPRASADLKRLSALTNDTRASSIDSGTGDVQRSTPVVRNLKSIVQFQC